MTKVIDRLLSQKPLQPSDQTAPVLRWQDRRGVLRPERQWALHAVTNHACLLHAFHAAWRAGCGKDDIAQPARTYERIALLIDSTFAGHTACSAGASHMAEPVGAGEAQAIRV